MDKEQKAKIMEIWKKSNNKLGFLRSWDIEDIRKGKHPDYENEMEFMRDLGENEGIQSVCHILSDMKLLD